MDPVYLLVPLIVAVAFFGQSVFGFGGGLVAIPLLSLVIGIKDAVTLGLIFQVLTGLLFFKAYKHIAWRPAKPMAVSLVIGTTAGTLFLSQANVMILQLILASTILLFLAKMLWFDGFTLGNKQSTVAAGIAGLSGGLFQGMTGVGGPPVTMYLSVVVKEKLAFRATLLLLLFVANAVRMAISIPNQLFTDHVLFLAVIATPFFLIAIFIGQRIHNEISDKYYRLGIYVLLGGSAILLLYKALG